MGDDDPPSSKREGKLERMIKIEVEKYPEPILTPEDERFKEIYSSMRNPGGVMHNGEIILLLTVRHTSDNKSRLHIAKSSDGYNFTLEEKPSIDLNPDSLMGVEDARITKIGDIYHILFTQFKETDGQTYNTTRIGHIQTKDFNTYTDRRIILDDHRNNKNGVILPNHGGAYVVHRPFKGEKEETPSAHISWTEDFKTFEDLGVYFSPRKGKWDSVRVGMNTPPIQIKTDKFGEVLFMLYHGADEENVYRMGYVLVDPNDPTKILERSDGPLISPDKDFEIGRGFYNAEVKNVVFGQGAIPYAKDKIRLYYGGADRHTNFADLTLKNAEILDQTFHLNFN